MRLCSRKIISGLVLFAFTVTQIFVFPAAYFGEEAGDEQNEGRANVAEATTIAEAASFEKIEKASNVNDSETVYDLIAIVVDSEVDKDLTSYPGLREKYPGELEAGTVGERIVRYAEDLREDNELTDVRVMIFDKNKDSVESLASALENLYINGEGTNNNRLAGVVLIGDVPLPVVNKEGNRFVSLFPYTDFENKAYIYNFETASFEYNSSVTFPKPEIWHGVMRVESDGQSGMEKLAQYLDKNHLYYKGVPEYANFEKKLFFADLVHEEENMNEEIYKQYLKYLESWEDLAYMRYNKFWAKELTDEMNKTVASIANKPDAGGYADILSNDPLGNLPDIQSKQIIDQFLPSYFKIFGSYLSKINDFAENTARYGSKDFDSVPVLISIKDEYTKQYLKNVNDALEKQINKVVAKIEEPLDLLEHAVLSGHFSDGNGVQTDFAVGLSGQLPTALDVTKQSSKIYFKYYYFNENTKDFYINGIEADLIESAKQCSVYLGSTKSEYFDENLNFNPKANVGGVYSILTRALRSDSTLTAAALQTAGVNTRQLSVKEAYALTKGAVSSGEVVEDNAQYGISAFLDNPIVSGNYANPWSKYLAKGDVIYKVGGKVLTPEYTFAAAISEAYKIVKRVITATNNGQIQKLTNFPYKIEPADNFGLDSGKIFRAAGILGIEYYQGGAKKTANLSFSVDKDGKTSSGQPAADGETGPRVLVVMMDNYAGFNFEAHTDGAIFTLYDLKQGFGGKGYDNSAGCNLASAGKNSDRCFWWTASMPVLDPAGALMPVKTIDPGQGPTLKFPEDYGKDESGKNNPAVYSKHTDVLQFPGGAKTDHYKFEDLDEVYYDSCYFGLPGIFDNENLASDSNPYGLVLDPAGGGSAYDILGKDSYPLDFAGKVLANIGNFVNGSGGDSKAAPDKNSTLLGLADLDAGDIILNNLNGPEVVTLKAFSDRWGLFDGVDNDNDGLKDFEWRDIYLPDGVTKGQDGVYETKWYDFDEASLDYAIPAENLSEIARKMLSHPTAYTLPAIAEISPFAEDITLNVGVKPYVIPGTSAGKKISSMVLHNEPTEHTIFEQVKSQSAFSLPIDNPRYVAFASKPVTLPGYPTPKPVASNPPIDVESILAGLDTKPYYFPGKTIRVDYPNLFKAPNYAQLKADLDTVAWKITEAFGSYKILTEGTPVNCSAVSSLDDSAKCKAIHDEIMKKYLEPVVNGILDSPVDGFELDSGSGEKIVDAFYWRDLNIDQKHDYILKYYLDDFRNAFVGDQTVFPANFGYEIKNGYEAMYLVLPGEKEHFDLGFNKDLPLEENKQFDPLALISSAGEGAGSFGEGASGAGGVGSGEEDDAGDASGDGEGTAEEEFEFVDLAQFLKELKDFISFFTTEPTLEKACAYAEEAKSDSTSKAAGVDENSASSDVGISILDELGDSEGEATAYGGQGNFDGKSLQINTYTAAKPDVPEFSVKELLEAEEAGLIDGGVDLGGGGEDEDGLSEHLIDNALKILDKEALEKDAEADEALGNEVDEILKSAPKDTFDNPGKGGVVNNEEDGSGEQVAEVEVDVENAEEGNEGSDAGNDATFGVQNDAAGEDQGGAVDGAESEAGSGGALPDTFGGDDDDSDIIILQSELLKWPEYFINKSYWEKFLDEQSSVSFSGRYLAEVFTDQNPFENSENIVELSIEIVADGESVMMVEAIVFDKNGQVENAPKKIKFSLADADFPEMASFINGPEVLSEKGKAVVYLKAGKKAGKVKIKAEVVDDSYPIGEKEIFLMPGPVSAVSIEVDSNVLVANGQAKTNLKVTLRDQFGNRATNSFAKIGLFVEGPGYIDAANDSDNTIPGVQIGTFEGFGQATLFAKDAPGEINVVALLIDYELEEKFFEAGEDWQGIDFSKYAGNFKKIVVLNDVDLRLTFDKKALLANGNDIAKLKVELVSGNTVLSGYNGPVAFKILDPALVSFAKVPPKMMVNGVLHEANLPIKSTKIAGESEVLVEVPGFVSSTVKIKSLSGKVSHIELTASDDVLYTGGENQVVLKARLIDKNGNPVETDNSTMVTFAPTVATEGFVQFVGAKSALALNGVASVIVTGKELSGMTNIIASATGALSGTVSLKVVKRTNGNDLAEMRPRALYASVLGGDFGNVMEKGSVALSLLDNIGQVQAVSSLTATTDDKKKLFYVDGFGKVEIFGEGISGEVLPASDSFPYQKVIFKEDGSGEILGETFMVLKNGNKIYLQDSEMKSSEEEEEEVADGIYVKNLAVEDKELLFEENGGKDLTIKKNGEVILKIDSYGRIALSDKKAKLRLIEEDDGIFVSDPAFVAEKNGVPIALISFRQNFKDINGQVKNVMVASDELNSFYPGIYVKKKTNSKRYEFSSGLSGASSNNPFGMYFVDLENKIEDSMAASVQDNFGFGFTGENKHMLLFAAGNSVGESNMPYASDAGIIFGDPNVRVKIKGIVGLVSELSGYSKDLGKPLFYGEDEISQMVNFDYNADGFDDILLIYEDGLVRLLQNEISRKRFRDQGYVLNIPLGVITATKIDVNNDGYSDLVVGTKESCKKDEVCVSLYTNKNGNLERETLNLAIEGKAYEMKSGDLNNDGCEDLVVSDSASNIRTFYNKSDGKNCLGLETNHGNTANFGLKVDSNINLKDNLFINYAGMPKMNLSYDPALDNSVDFVKFVLRLSGNGGGQFASAGTDFQAGILNNPSIAGKEVPPQTYPQEFDFVNLVKDARFGPGSFKKAVDLNGGSVNAGDEIEYVITLKNDGQSSISNLRLSDATPPSMTLVLDSLACLDSGCKDDLQWTETGMSLRSQVISNISVPAGGVRTIRYRMTINSVPTVHFDIGNNFTNYKAAGVIVPKDEYPDIRVRPEVNPNNILTYLYSKPALDSNNHVQYLLYEESPTASNNQKLYQDQYEEAGLPDLTEIPTGEDIANNLIYEGGIPVGLDPAFRDLVDEQLSKVVKGKSADSDSDGCINAWDSFKNDASDLADSVADSIQNFTSMFRCSGGGCLPIPYNYVFFAPDGAVPGIATMAFGVPNPIGFAPFYPSVAPSTTRFYVNPTLTMGLGTSICMGAPQAGLCYAFAVPVSSLGLCPDFLGPINDAIASAKNVVSSGDAGMSTVVAGGDASSGSDAINLGGNYSGDGPFSAASAVNVRIPGFPSVITNWIDKQTDEIYGKLLDLPDFYFIYPDVKTLISDTALASANFSKIKNVNDFLNAINSLPLIQIEGREVTLKLPAISKDEIEKWKRQGALWITYHKNQLEYLNNFWQCDLSEARKTLCDKVNLKLGGFVHDVEKFMDKLDQIANLPMEILKWRNVEAKYATQLICYLDAIMQYTGGYINKQQKRIQSWMKAMEDAINTFKSWKILLDVMAEYQESCDECKNDRFSKLGLILQLFMVIPDPPIIPIPKWPDIVFDISQIKAGIKIVWPDIIFLPEPVTLPDLPVINLPKLPEALPDLTIDLDSIDLDLPDWLMEFPTVVMPDLPDLPPLPLPKLPDLPRPPKIPSLPNVVGKIGTVLKAAFKILCLLKKGFVPVLESALATEIETLTQPNINVVLPIIKNLGFQWPAIQYDYLEQIRINAKLNMGIDTDFIYNNAKDLTDKSNKKIEELVEEVNNYTDLPLQELLNGLINKGVEKAREGVKENLDLEENLGVFNGTFDQLGGIVEEFIADADIANVEESPEVYYLTAEQELLESSDPRLNRSLAQIEADILRENLPQTDAMKQMAEVRDSLVAYAQGLQDTNKLLRGLEDYGEFVKVLAENDNSVRQFASAFAADEVEAESKTVAASFFDEGVKEALSDSAGMYGKRYLAAAIDQKEAFKQTTNSSIPTPKGFYVVVANKNENILNYTSELSKNVNNFFNDVDHDGDFDLIYSMGGDVYLKMNYKNNPTYEKGDVIINPAKSGVSDFVPEGGTMVNGVSVPYENSKKAEITWMAKYGAVKYEVIVRKSLNDADAAYVHLVDQPKITLDIENGNYYVNVFAIDKNGKRSLSSESIVISPQVCSDKDAPLPAVNKSSFKVPIFSSLELDASESFDTTSEITQYYVELDGKKTLWSDLNPAIDENGDGITANDKTNPRFNIGPFNEVADVGMHKAILHVVDEAGNSSAQEISIEVFVPEISLDESFARTKVAIGKTDPPASKMPFSLWRNRYIYRVVQQKLTLVPRLDKVQTGAISTDGKYYTRNNGEYEISDFELENMILVEDANGKIVAEIDPETGNIGNLAAGHSTKVIPAVAPVSPTSVSIVDSGGSVLGNVYVIGDPNVDAKIHNGITFDAKNYKNYNGVNVSDQDSLDDFEFRYFGAADKTYPGGIYLVNLFEEDKTMLIVDAAGNILKLDERITLKQKPNQHAQDPLVILVLFDSEIVAEIYVSLTAGMHIVGPNDVPFVTPRAPSAKVFYHAKEEPLSDVAKNYLILQKKGIVDDLTNIEAKVNRAEFVKILLNMLCIIPRKEAYLPYGADEAGGGFSDVAFKSELDWFYPYVKEGALRGLIEGYKGETDEKGLHPFKPENTISRAEAVKIILEAMEHKGVIDLSAIVEGTPWYGPYMQIAQNLSPLLNKGEVLKNNFIVTKEEALLPDKELTRGELLDMALLVLDIYNCFELDNDKDGMSDFCEEKNGIDDPFDDPDQDGLKNIDECYYNLDPNKADTDGGQSLDGAEIDFGTDPFNPNDDPLDTDYDGLTDAAELFVHFTDLNDPDSDDGGVGDGQEVKDLSNPLFKDDDGVKKEYQEGEPGIYIVPADCNSCPCASTFLNKADVVSGDIFFTVISTYDEKNILNKSNDVVVE